MYHIKRCWVLVMAHERRPRCVIVKFGLLALVMIRRQLD